jgi:hypothetical protein
MATTRAPDGDDLHVRGVAVVYRLFDIGYAIELDHAAELLVRDAPARARPARVEAQALLIANPPVTIQLGAREIAVDGNRCRAQLLARIFDFGVLSLKLEISGADTLPWDGFVDFARLLERAPDVDALFARELDTLRERIAPAIDRASLAPVREEYIVFRISALRREDGSKVESNLALSDARLAPLLLGEPRTLAPEALRDLLHHRFSYYADDLVVLTWENALVVEPATNDRDVEYILEFANAQLLELRYYDAVLDAELPAMYDRVEDARRRRRLPTRRFHAVLADLQTRIADVTETVERADNALKVTDDVYLARVYGAALDLFRAEAWRRGIERKLEIFRSTYAMLNGEAQSARAELLEVAIVVLIVAELVLGLMRR